MKILVEKNQVIEWLGDTLIIDGYSIARTNPSSLEKKLDNFEYIPHPEKGLWGYRSQVYDVLKDMGGARTHYELHYTLKKMGRAYGNWQTTYQTLRQLKELGVVSLDNSGFRNYYTINQGRLLVEKIEEAEHQLDSLIRKSEPDGSHCFYVALENEEKTRVKFGYSYHPSERVHELKLANSPMILLCAMPGSPHMETLIKKRWWAETIDHREIFSYTKDMENWLKEEIKARNGHWFE